MLVFKSENFAGCYKDSLIHLLNAGLENRARSTVSTELLDVALVIEDPTSCIYANQARGSQLKYIAAELIWYYSGRNDVKFISKWAKFWETIQNHDGSANSAYGNLLFTVKNEYHYSQYQWALQSLINDPNTRQAIMHLNQPVHQYNGNKDFVCTMYVNCHIRENRLYMTTFMRSNDAIWGTPTDVAFFCSLQMQMLSQLRHFYPDLELGTYTHVANSYHIYDRHYDMVKRMLGSDFSPMSLPKIETDLINIDGSPSKDLLTLAEAIEADSPRFLIFQDGEGLLKWIYQNVTADK